MLFEPQNLIMLSPCLILGSGFHRWVLGHGDSPLCDWHKLIDSVATQLKISRPAKALNPVFRWERLIQVGITDGFYDPLQNQWASAVQHTAGEVEGVARAVVSRILEEQEFSYPGSSRRALYPVSGPWGAVVSLNFDSAILGKNYAVSDKYPEYLDKSRHTERNFLYATRNDADCKIWYPNGIAKKSKTIKMGLRDYGQSPYHIGTLFNLIKAYENSVGIAGKVGVADNSVDGYLTSLFQAIESKDERVSHLDNWVTNILYRPLFFAGVGMSESESGLWWLMAQRSRNHARFLENAPKAYILVAEGDRSEFWATKPFGIEAISCADWDTGWEKLREKAIPMRVDGGQF